MAFSNQMLNGRATENENPMKGRIFFYNALCSLYELVDVINYYLSVRTIIPVMYASIKNPSMCQLLHNYCDVYFSALGAEDCSVCLFKMHSV